MVVPALLYIAVNLRRRAGACAGWACRPRPTSRSRWRCSPSISTHLPAALRTFLLTLAVVDDLLAITIIAVFYTATLQLLPLAAGRCCRWRCSRVLVQRRVRSWWLLLPLAAATWALVHASGVHATVAGVLLGVHGSGGPGARRAPGPAWPSTSSTAGGRCRPVSRCRCSRSSPPACRWPAPAGSARRLRDPVTIGIIAGLVVGKTVGIVGATWLVQRFTRAELADGPELVGRARAGAARRDRVHRVAADRRAGVRCRQRHATSTQDRRAARLAGRGRCSPRPCCVPVTGTTAASVPRRRWTTAAAHPTWTRTAAGATGPGPNPGPGGGSAVPAWLFHGWAEGAVAAAAAKAAGMYAVALIGLRLSPRRMLSQWTAIDVPAVRRAAGPAIRKPRRRRSGQPQIHRRTRHSRQSRDLQLRSTVGPPQHNPRPRRHRGRNIRAVHQRGQLSPLLRRQLHSSSQSEGRSSERKDNAITRH